MWLCAALFVYQSFALHVNNIRVMVWSLTCCQLSAPSKTGDAKRRDSQMGFVNLEICIISIGAVVNMENMGISLWISGPDLLRHVEAPNKCTIYHYLLS